MPKKYKTGLAILKEQARDEEHHKLAALTERQRADQGVQQCQYCGKYLLDLLKKLAHEGQCIVDCPSRQKYQRLLAETPGPAVATPCSPWQIRAVPRTNAP